MIVADTSAWVELLRDSAHPVAATLASLIERDADVAITEVVFAELLAGARTPETVRELRSRLLAFPILPLEGLADYEEAALLQRGCRTAGESIRGLTDCLIAVPTIRAGATLLHNDRDFEVIARHSSLRILVAT